MTLYILTYNNYYNRLVKYEDTVTAYSRFVNYTLQSTNFNPNNGINTTHLVGTGDYFGEGDYLLVVDDTRTIKSRWFIVDVERTRGGQYSLTLRRDVIADYYNVIINSPMFIEKAIVPDNNYLVYNAENYSVNQIKTKETLLKDETGCQWLVGYVTRQSTELGGGATPLSAKIKYFLDYTPDEIVTSESQLSFYQYLNRDIRYAGTPTFDFFFNGGSNTVVYNSINQYGPTTTPARLKSNSVETGFGWLTSQAASNSSNYYYGYENRNYITGFLNKTPANTAYSSTLLYGNRHFADYLYNAISGASWTSLLKQVNVATGNVEQSEITKYANKVVKIGANYYRTEIENVNQETSTSIVGSLPNVEVLLRGVYNVAVRNYLNDYPEAEITTSLPEIVDSNQLVGIRASSSGTARLVLKPFTNTKVQAELNTDSFALSCVDSPYDIITMPYSDTLEINTIDGETFVANKDLALATMTALLGQEGGVGAVKDVQLLPYCPLRQFIDVDGNIDLSLSNEDTGEQFSTRTYYITAEGTGVRLQPIMYCQYSSASFNIPLTVAIKNAKVESICDMYRLCSPNFASIFEFNAAKNGGISKINVDFNYKPFSPYIHLNPDFKRLYGKDFNDPRGLICGGDFSISSTTDAWEQYELQNKNYEKSFQRQIDYMETQNDIARRLEGWGIATGTVSGVASGAVAGGVYGGAPGAIVGAAVGGISSLVGGIEDYKMNEKLRTEAIDYAKDQFGYQLDNIKAIPNTIAKVTTFNANNKGFPVLEYYTCSTEEKEAFANKIAWNGMSVGVISTPVNYIGNNWEYETTFGEIIKSKGYFKGSLIRIENFEEDFYVLKTISDELYKGVYITQ